MVYATVFGAKHRHAIGVAEFNATPKTLARHMPPPRYRPTHAHHIPPTQTSPNTHRTQEHARFWSIAVGRNWCHLSKRMEAERRMYQNAARYSEIDHTRSSHTHDDIKIPPNCIQTR